MNETFIFLGIWLLITLLGAGMAAIVWRLEDARTRIKTLEGKQ